MTLFLIKTISVTLALFLATKILKVKAGIVGLFLTAVFMFFLLNIFSGYSAIVVCLILLITFITMNVKESVKMTLLILIIGAVIHITFAFAYVSFARDMIFGKKPVIAAEVVTTEDGTAPGTPGVNAIKETVDPRTLEEVYQVMFKSNNQFGEFFNGWMDSNSRYDKTNK